MAQKIQTLFIDDIDGGTAEGTVRFGLDGTEYEIDLSARHTEELRKVLANYVAHGRKAAARPGAPPVAAAPAPALSTPPRSANGRRDTATTSRSAAGSRPTSSSSTGRLSAHKPVRLRAG